MQEQIFKFKQFEISQDKTTMKVNSDGILLGAWSDASKAASGLDIGTGTGVIAIMLAQKNTNIHVVGIDVEGSACIQAKENMANSEFSNRLECVHISIQDFIDSTEKKYDLIVSNPPFFSGGTFSMNENKANVRHTIKLSHSDLLRSVKKILSNHGYFDVILPYIEGLRFIEMAEKYDLYLHEMLEVKPRENKNIERLLLRFNANKPDMVTSNSIVMYADADSKNYSGEYVELTKPFYLHL